MPALRVPLLLLATSLAACDGGSAPAKVPSAAEKAASVERAGECKGVVKEKEPVPKMKVPSVNNAGTVDVGATGKVMLIDFWATWCGPCKESFPKYQDLYVKYKASGLELVAISLDDESNEIGAFVKATGVKFPVGWDGGKKAAPCFDIKNMPTAYIVDKKGVVRHVHRGYHANEEKEIEKEIKELL